VTGSVRESFSSVVPRPVGHLTLPNVVTEAPPHPALRGTLSPRGGEGHKFVSSLPSPPWGRGDGGQGTFVTLNGCQLLLETVERATDTSVVNGAAYLGSHSAYEFRVSLEFHLYDLTGKLLKACLQSFAFE
jgi:hypothetical protein